VMMNHIMADHTSERYVLW